MRYLGPGSPAIPVFPPRLLFSQLRKDSPWGTGCTTQVPASILRFRHRAKRGSSSAEHCFDRQPLPMGPIPLGMTNEHQCLRMHVAREFKCPAYDLWAVHGSSHPTAAETSSPGGKEQGLERTAH